MSGADDMNSEQDRVSAYLGGAMTPTEAAAFEQEMEGDAQLAAIVERWQRNDALLKQAFSSPEAETVSGALLDRLGLADVPADSADSNVVAIGAAKRPTVTAQNDNSASPQRRWAIAGSIAASVAVAIAVGSFWTSKPEGIGSEPVFQSALDGSASGTSVALNDQQKLTPILSFKADDGRFCREFALEGQGGGEQGVACKSGQKWEIEALVKGGGVLPTNSEIRTAAGQDAASLDSTYSRLGAGDPLSRENEMDAISEGWVKK
jgi:anti-sigma-K factor RskA